MYDEIIIILVLLLVFLSEAAPADLSASAAKVPAPTDIPSQVTAMPPTGTLPQPAAPAADKQD